MEFDFESLNNPALVEQKKKYATFTIKEIGGPDEIVKWREMQAAKEANYRIRLKERDDRLGNFEAETGQKLDQPKIHTTSWAEKLAFAKSEQARLAEKEEVASWSYQPAPEPKKSVFKRIKGFFVDLWNHSNF